MNRLVLSLPPLGESKSALGANRCANCNRLVVDTFRFNKEPVPIEYIHLRGRRLQMTSARLVNVIYFYCTCKALTVTGVNLSDRMRFEFWVRV